MADIEANIITFLSAQAGVQAIFGSSPSRIYVERKDPAITTTYPYAILRTVTQAPDYAHDGSLPDSGLYQIDVYSDSKPTVNSGEAAISAELSGYSGSMGTATVGASFIEDVRGDFEPDDQNFRRSIDVSITQNG